MHPIASSTSTQAILSASNLNASHTALTVVEESEKDEKLDVPSEEELAALRHRYAFLALKFVLGVWNASNPVHTVQYERVQVTVNYKQPYS